MLEYYGISLFLHHTQVRVPYKWEGIKASLLTHAVEAHLMTEKETQVRLDSHQNQRW